MIYYFGSRKPRLRHSDPSRWPRGTLYPQKSTLTSPKSGGRSVGRVRSRTQATEFSFFFFSFNRVKLNLKMTNGHVARWSGHVQLQNVADSSLAAVLATLSEMTERICVKVWMLISGLQCCHLFVNNNTSLRVKRYSPCGGGLEYFHRSYASRKRRQKGNTVSDETVMYGYWSSVTGLDL
jgi:hypothetical protein